ncbi:hypothetical protein VNO77_00258 [Canavalia gladiata]|uniref:Uncharacterized protein n=1 Tax=Canavalia gladiata TaxID=3824 RepID=A0AAN9MQT3_CANGL
MMTNPKACFSEYSQWPPKSFRLRRGLRASAAIILPWILYIMSMMINPKACFSKHSQWPPKSFRLRQA